jgi:hypothetical protein
MSARLLTVSLALSALAACHSVAATMGDPKRVPQPPPVTMEGPGKSPAVTMVDAGCAPVSSEHGDGVACEWDAAVSSY